jgi:hypothetical protein
MAVGLGLLGRGGTRQALGLWLLHVAAAALAGALLGGLLGGLGALLGLAAWRPWVIGAAAVVAFTLALPRPPPKLGRQRQVPRRWAPGTSPARVYLVWGAMLGSGVATPIFHTAFLVLLAAQLTCGVALGLVSGALFGAARQATALLPLLGRLDPGRTMDLLETLRPVARRLNAALIVTGGLILVLAGR